MRSNGLHCNLRVEKRVNSPTVFCVYVSVYVSATLILVNISETKRFRGSCPIGAL